MAKMGKNKIGVIRTGSNGIPILLEGQDQIHEQISGSLCFDPLRGYCTPGPYF